MGMMDPNCLFCRIIRGEIPSKKVHEDDLVLVFADINPVSPGHLLIVPKDHIATVNDLEETHKELVGHMFVTAAAIARQSGFAAKGYRLVSNTNSHGGQTVFHLHIHLLSGRALGWPPG